MKRIAMAALLAVRACAPMPAPAAPPPGADPSSAMSKWVRSLRTPEGYSCCSEADCRNTAMQMREDGTRWAWIGKDEYGADAPDAWVRITDRVWNETTPDGDPPDGRAYVCFYGGRLVCAKSAGGY